jgi:hypothetical protein
MFSHLSMFSFMFHLLTNQGPHSGLAAMFRDL